MLTQHKGGLGDGYLAPNLSGLLTEFYPLTYVEKKNWTLKGLQDWLKNPRKLLNNAGMLPVPLEITEWQRLQEEFLGEGVQSKAGL